MMHFINIFNLHMKPAFPELSRESVVAAVCFFFFLNLCIRNLQEEKKNTNKYVYQLR